MSRTKKELESKDNEKISEILDDILTSKGYTYTWYKNNENVWKQGDGLTESSKYIKYYFIENKLFIEGWVDNFGRESELKGVIGSLPKGNVKNIIKIMEERVVEFNNNTNTQKTNSDSPKNENTISQHIENNNNTEINTNNTNNTVITTTNKQPTKVNYTGQIIFDIIGMIISIIIICLGLSGGYVLRGTNSSEALVLFGIAFLIYDIYRLAKHTVLNKAPKNDNKTNNQHTPQNNLANNNNTQDNIQTQTSNPTQEANNNNITNIDNSNELTNNAFESLTNIEKMPNNTNTPPNTNNQNNTYPNQNPQNNTNPTTNNQPTSFLTNMSTNNKIILAIGIVIILILAMVSGLFFSSLTSSESDYYDRGYSYYDDDYSYYDSDYDYYDSNYNSYDDDSFFGFIFNPFGF